MKGSCLCKNISFRLTGTIPHLYQCHCSLCRKLTGSASDSAFFIAKENFQWLSGQESISSYRTKSGFRSDFCRQCGSTVPHLMTNKSQFWVPAGLLDEQSEHQVVAHLFVDSKASWDVIADGAVQYDEMPEISELNQLLQRENE